ncbi:MAG: hypothetical protein Q8L15_18435 [Methylobacter sp.]|nr:hypothetical protein [Methylobacter sp.]
MSEEHEITDTDRLDWLIKNGYTPAKWRPWTLGDPDSKSGMTMIGLGTRKEIDDAIVRHNA